MMKSEDQLLAKVVAALFLLATIVSALLAFQNYRYGLYDLVYSASLIAVFYLIACVYARFSPEARHLDSVSLAVLILTLLVILKDSLYHAQSVQHWAYPLGLLSYIALNHRLAALLNVTACVFISLCLYWQDGLAVATTYASTYTLMIALASVYATLHQRRSRTLVELEIRDPLTGAYNFRHLEDTLKKEICRADRTGKTLSLIALEIDYFPQILDLHGGHATNDLVKEFSAKLAAMTRAGDSEYCDNHRTFYLLLPCTPSEGVLVIAERIRRAMEEDNWPVVDSITVSLGCTSYITGTRSGSANGLINDTNIALVEAQKNGHNRVCHHN